ncbi:hypothetical protein CK203_055793 [Vitis vinifera]|uniref:Uncharacterized protein n=1 Tax=Vitis vinifera TaxID=29760 RepID=A0A438H6F0_VITVI|nr:hypothetical protein CK203_055793 [Vitis vinifera]
MPHFPGIGHFSEHPYSEDDRSSCSLGADYRHSTQHTAILRQIQHHLGIISAPEHATPSHQSHHRPLLSLISLCLLRS